MQCYAMPCHAIPPYHTYHKYVGLFAAFPLSAFPQSSRSAPTFSTSKHAFTSFYSDLAVDFISSSFFLFPRLSAMLRIVCFFPTSFSFILRACGCIQIWNRKSFTARKRKSRESESEWERKTLKLLENLLCESEWVCAFSIKFNKHTKWVEPKSSEETSERARRRRKRKKTKTI